jgi:hypothetical protein
MERLDQTSRILVPGATCWRVERAKRLSVIVDAADYFAAIREAVRKARHTVMLVGWDFDTRISSFLATTPMMSPTNSARFSSGRSRPDPI